MIEAICRRTEEGFVPDNEEEAAKLAVYQVGNVVRMQFKKMRNPKFFRKWWVLAKYAYDYWTDTQEMPEYKGEKIQPNFKRFRKDLVIMAGHFTYVVNINLEVRAEADSLKWGSMTEDTFEELYSNTINAILKKIYKNKGMSEEKLRGIVEEVLSFV